MDKIVRKQELRTDEIHEIISSPPNFLTKWGTSIIIMIMVILIGFSFFISYPLVVRGKVQSTFVNKKSVECLIFIESDDLYKLQIGQEVTIGNKGKNEMLVGNVDSILSNTSIQVKAIFPIGENIMHENIPGKDVRIIVGEFYLGNKILESFMNLFIEHSNEKD